MLRDMAIWLMHRFGIHPQYGIVVLCTNEEDAMHTARPIGATITVDPETIMRCVANGVHVTIPMNRFSADCSFPFDVTVTTSLQWFYRENPAVKPAYIN